MNKGTRLLALLLSVGATGCSDVDSSPQEQDAASTTAKVGEAPPSLEEAVAITQAYGEVLQSAQSNGDFCFGTSQLPEPKARIRAALFRMLDSVDARTDDEFLKAAVLQLAFFQDGVDGMTPLSATAPDGRSYREIVAAEVSELAYELAQKGHGAPPS